MTAVAVCLFPGQGSQRVGMGRDLAAAFPVARRTFEEADARLDMPLSQLCFEGPEETLVQTEHAQPAIVTASVAAYRVLEETAGMRPIAVSGHSVGEWSALVAAGALSLGDAVAAVRERGRLMQSAVPEGVGAMAAIMGLESDVVNALCADAAGGEVVVVANFNGGGQLVVAGHARAVDRLVALAGARGGKTRRLAVSGPFHSPLMAPAGAALARFIRSLDFRAPKLTVVSSVEGRPVRGAEEIPELLARQLTSPVRWEEAVRRLAALHATVALETGPGRVLCGLAKRIAPSLTAIPAGDLEGIERAREALAA